MIESENLLNKEYGKIGENISNRTPDVGSLSQVYSNINISPEADARLSIGNSAFILVQFKTSEPMLNGNRPNVRRVAQIIQESKDLFNEVVKEKTSAKLMREFKYSPVVSLSASKEDIETLATMDEVVRITENYLYKPFLNNSFVQVGAEYPHSIGKDGNGCTIAVFDSGIEENHTMFSEGKIVASACFNTTIPDLSIFGLTGSIETSCANGLDDQISFTDGSAGATCDLSLIGSCFHGNHVAGIAAGGFASVNTDPISEIMGIASGANLIGMNVFSTIFSPEICGSPNPCILSFTEDQLNAFDWVVDNADTYNICASNLSLGGGRSFTNCDDDPAYPVITLLRDMGVATVIATGNGGFDDSVSFPSCISSAISVGSVGATDMISGFSNHSDDLVDLMAPGELILSAYGVLGGSTFYAFASGTSMATPHVAGAFAMMKAEFPNLSVDEIESTLKNTGDTVADEVRGQTGQRIQLEAACRNLISRFRAIPTMGEWGLISLSFLLLIFGVVRIRQQQPLLIKDTGK